MKHILAVILLMGFSYSIMKAQGVGINETGLPPHPTAMLDIESTTKGMLVPRMTLNQRDQILTPAEGLLIYQTDNSPGLYMYENGTWSVFASASNVWMTTGNYGTDPESQFIGTTDNVPIRFRLNNQWAGELNPATQNVFIGDSSGIATTGNWNTALGHKSLKSNTTGQANIAIGYHALSKNVVSNNVAIGFESLQENSSGVNNTALGYRSLRKNTSGIWNTSVGYSSLQSNTTGGGNASFGYSTLTTNTTGNNNSAFGQQSMYLSVSGNDNTAVGAGALFGNNSGHENTAVGSGTLQYCSQCSANTAIGFNAQLFGSSAFNNTSVGHKTLRSNLNGDYNTAVGAVALQNNTASMNTAIGSYALHLNTSGSDNTATGYGSLTNNSTGIKNTGTGAFSLTYNTTGTHNTAVGEETLQTNLTGNYNVAVGIFSNVAYPDLYNTTSIANSGIPNADHNQVIIGNMSHEWIGGKVPWSVFSDARIKTDIAEDVKGLDFILKLRPVTYHTNSELHAALIGAEQKMENPYGRRADEIKFSGFLAQEVEQAANDSGYEFSGITKPKNEKMIYSLSYETFVVPLVKGMQEQQDLIEEQKAIIETLIARIEALEKKVK